MEYLKINPIKELLKVIEIIHGKSVSDVYERVILKVRPDLLETF